MIIAQQRAGQFEEIRIGIGVAGGLSKRGQLEIDIAGEFAFPGYRLRTRVSWIERRSTGNGRGSGSAGTRQALRC